MVKRKISLLLILSALVIVLTILNYVNSSRVKDRGFDIQVLEQLLHQKSVDFIDLNHLYTQNIGRKLDSTIQVKSLDGKLTTWGDVIDSDHLYFVFNQVSCSDCIIEEFNYMKKLPDSIQNKIVFLADYKKPSDLSQLVRVNQIHYPIYIVDNGYTSQTFNTELPLFFKVNQFYKISRFHVCLQDAHKSFQSFIKNFD